MKITDLYKVETLDTRFGSSNDGQPLPHAQPSKWNTPEYYLYCIVFLTIPFLMFKSVYDVSQPTHPSYEQYEHLLEPGWIPGRKVDNSDAQYSGFRENVPYMAILLIAHPILRRTWEAMQSKTSLKHANGTKGRDQGPEVRHANDRMESRVRFDVGFAMVYIFALHGVSALKVLSILYVNYKIATALPKPYVATATWVFNIGILFANELGGGYPFARVATLLSTSSDSVVNGKVDAAPNWGAWLDSFGGLVPRWEVLFNITVLRLIAFNFDYLWMLDRRASSPIEKKGIDPAALTEKDRIKFGAYPSDFTFRNYLAYVLYSPLYLVGPIINFNDYIGQVRHAPPSTTRSRIVPYAVRFVICLLTMELVLHFLYAVAISKSNPNWTIYTPFQLSMLGYFNLHIIWLKLLIPWRFFRLWALVDGIDPPENMVRCMSDNYSALAFWRGWHRSLNQWITRYIFIPMGGSRVGTVRAIVNFIAVFTFVALWHDINLRLLVWGWLIILFILPEAIATLLFPAKNFKDRPNTYRWLCGIGAVGNILMMMVANLVGFAVGVDGIQGLMDGIVSSLGGRLFLLMACVTLFVGVQVMFEVRAAEKRRGINMKC